jgi:hypothetical protein
MILQQSQSLGFSQQNQILVKLLMVFTAKPVSRIFPAKSDSRQSFDVQQISVIL